MGKRTVGEKLHFFGKVSYYAVAPLIIYGVGNMLKSNELPVPDGLKFAFASGLLYIAGEIIGHMGDEKSCLQQIASVLGNALVFAAGAVAPSAELNNGLSGIMVQVGGYTAGLADASFNHPIIKGIAKLTGNIFHRG